MMLQVQVVSTYWRSMVVGSRRIQDSHGDVLLDELTIISSGLRLVLMMGPVTSVNCWYPTMLLKSSLSPLLVNIKSRFDFPVASP